ncbi:MAG: ribonuclease, Rne/Rng family, partial [Modestobacter sp.]|nr:ribonuclease, Rne/Rng family [Modestobacter sp.]
MADRIDENTPETEQGTAGETPQAAPAPEAPAAETPAPETPAAETPAAEVPAPDTAAEEVDEDADGEPGATLDFSAPPPVLAAAPVDEAPRFAAPFSSPEPTTVTARPRRRATRPALSADPDSVAPAAAQVAPAIPAFVSFVAPPEADAVAPRRRGRRPQAESPVESE